MCGINGIVTYDENSKHRITKMNDLVKHRGPDDEGYVVINSITDHFQQCSGNDSITYIKNKFRNILQTDLNQFDVILAHRRLSIIDLSENGHGPMGSADNKLWITFNGEIYNYIELRKELEQNGFIFKTKTDTEVIINSYKFWGIECLNKFNGMWAFAIWDCVRKELFLARDRFGVKPLYYSFSENSFAFSSELKPLLFFSQNTPQVNRAKIPFYIIYGNRLNTDETYFEDVHSLPASHYMILKDNKIDIKRYYDLPVNPEHSESEEELKNKIVDILTDSIKLRYRSDVAVGACLSGGFDSSSIVSLSKHISGNSLNTFSAVWDEKNCDESEYIDIVNKQYGCKSHKIKPKPEEFEVIFDKLNYYQEIPTEGPGLYPQWYVMQEASSKIKVLLDGQGGDEVFGGYFLTGHYLRSLVKDKRFFRTVTSPDTFFRFFMKNGLHSFLSWVFPNQYLSLNRSKYGNKFRILNQDNFREKELTELLKPEIPEGKYGNFLNNVSYQFIYLQTLPSLLHYEDRSSMAHSIESRVPFLDYRLVELGINLKPDQLSNKGLSRPLYRNALAKHLPVEIVTRKDKLGFPTPFSGWTKGILKEMILDNLLNPNSQIGKYIDVERLQINLNDHFSGRKDFSWEIWRLLSLEKFLNLFINNNFVNLQIN